MQRVMLKSKIHRATITDANLEYEGSITLDPVLMEAADILVGEQVHVVNINNGARFETYTILGKPYSGTVCVNGAASRLVQPKDRIIIISYQMLKDEEARQHAPKVVLVDEQNQIQETKSNALLK